MNDLSETLFSTQETPTVAINLTTRDAQDYILTDFLMKAYVDARSIVSKSVNVSMPLGFSLLKWLVIECDAPLSFDENQGYLPISGDFLVSYRFHGKSLNFTLYANSEEIINKWLEVQKSRHELTTDVQTVMWITGKTWRDVEMKPIPLESNKEILSAYPWLKSPVKSYAEEFMTSSASILILIGPPGTGKTSFLKSLLIHSSAIAAVTYETSLLAEDGLFSHFISDRGLDMLIFEDADTFLGTRKDGNDMMHRFLNVSNGLISPLKGKKLIFTTNLPSTQDIDEALMRPGRCFDVVHFRSLDREEARTVYAEVNGSADVNLPNSTYTLAEITNLDQVNKSKQGRKIGFL